MKRLIGALIIVALAVVGGRYAFVGISGLSWFRLAEVEISCPEHLTEKQVLEASRLKIGESIFDQQLDAAGDSLMNLPGVEAVDVRRKLPSKVIIDIYPEEVVLFVKTDKMYGLTKGLKLIDLKAMDHVLPVVTGLSTAKKYTYQNKLNLCYALSLYEQLCSLSDNLTGRLSEIHFVDNSRVEMFFDPGGAKVLLPLRDSRAALSRLVVLDSRGILGNSGSFDMTAGKMVVRHGV